MDKTLQKIYDDSEKAEFLETINAILPDCKRVIVLFETTKEDMSDFQYFQLGFKQTYEVLGFLHWFEDMTMGAEEKGCPQ